MYEDAANLWGERPQVAMLAEEATELSLAVQHHLRGRDADIAGEAADVLIMLEQVCTLYPDLWNAINERARAKLGRLAGRIESSRGSKP
jgi:NTP pyrophosphatase (non-canonical NTP hydrolase)